MNDVRGGSAQPAEESEVGIGDLQTAVDELHDPRVSAVAKGVAALMVESQELHKPDKQKHEQELQHEVRSDGRTELVQHIGEVRAQVAALEGGADPNRLAVR